MEHHIFLSYSRKDVNIMTHIRDDFHSNGLSVWTDAGIEPGTPSWKRAIESAILNAGCIVCILSPDAAASKWVRAELDFAELQEKPIFLVLARGDERDAIPFGFASSQWIDIRKSSNHKSPTKQLIPVIQKRLENSGLTLSTQVKERELILPKVEEILPPPFEWCEIPEGRVTLEKDLFLKGVPAIEGEFLVERFFIAKYPITNAQYQVFLDAGDGYRDENWWGYSDFAWDWRRTFKKPKPQAFIGDDLPRTMVSWFDALAFCRWLMSRTKTGLQNGNLVIRLPTEQQWQRAAQGNDGREYPWGNEFDANRCNVSSENKGQPTPVTYYPQGASPYGVMDMSDNVGDWCLNEWGTVKISSTTSNPRIVRGGSWLFEPDCARCAFRNLDDPEHAANNTGFRITLNSI